MENAISKQTIADELGGAGVAEVSQPDAGAMPAIGFMVTTKPRS